MPRRSLLRALVVAAAAACGGDAVGPPPVPTPTQLSMVTQPGASVQNGAAFAPQPAVRLRDAQGLPVARAGVAVQVQLMSGGAALGGTTSITTDGSGVATFAGLTLTGTVGAYTLQFTSGSLTAATANPVTLAPGAPKALAIALAPSAAAQAGSALAQQPQVRLKDQSGNDATGAGITVTASLVAGAATLSNATAVTNAGGLATFSGLALSGTVGTYTLRFTAPNLTAVDAPAATVLAAGPPTQLALQTQPSATLVNGATFAVQPVVELRDAFGNAVLQSGTVVTASILTGTGTLNGTATATTDAQGRAAYAGLGITGTAGTFTLRFAATGVASVVSNGITLTAGAAVTLQLVTSPSIAATNAVALAQQPVVQVQDASGNAVAGAGTTVTAGIITPVGVTPPVIAGGTAVTDAAGNATFSGLTLTGRVETYRLTFSAPGLAADTSLTPTVIQAGAATRLVILQAPGVTAANGQRLAVQPVVRLRDVSGNDVAQANVVVTASLATGSAALTHAAESTAANGVATFDSLTITGQVGSYSLRFSAPGLAGADAPAPTVLAPGAPTHLTLTTQPASAAQSGVALVVQPVAQLRDVSGNAVPLAGRTVTAAVVSGSATLANATATTSAAGTAAFATLALSGAPGAVALQFTATGVTAVDAAAPVVLGAGPAAALALTTEPAASAQSGVALTTQPVIQLRDGTGNAVPLAGVTVTASLVSGSLTLANATAQTLASGAASFAGLTLTGVAGNYRLRFSAPGVTGVDAAAVTALAAGAATAVTLTSAPPAAAQSGIALTTQPVVQLRDAAGNAVPQAGVLVTASLVSGSLTLANASVLTDGGGTAAFGTLTLTGTVGSYTLRFSAAGIGNVTAPAATALAAGAADHLVLATQPSTGALNGVALLRQPVVQVLDAAGNLVTGSAAAVTATTTAGVVLTNGSATASSGVATFSGLTLTGTAGSYLLSFASPGLGSVNASASTALGVGAAAGVALSQAPSAAPQSGIVMPQQPAVTVTDVSGNLVAGVVVTVTADNGGTVLNAAATTNGSGVASFAGMALVGAAGPYTLTFTAGAAFTTAGVALAAGSAASIAVPLQPSTSATSGAALATQPIVHVQDGSANPVQGAVVAASLTTAGATVTGATAVTNAAGDALFSGLTLAGTVGFYTLQFTAGGLAPMQASAPTALAAGPAAKLALTTQPSATATNGTALASQPVVQVTDAAGNAVTPTGTVVTASIVGGGPALANPAATTAGGVAAFSGLALAGTVGSYTLRFTAPGLDSVEAAAPTVLQVGTATQLAMTTQPSTAAQSGVALAQQPALQLRDAGGNAVALAGVDVTASVVGGGATVTGALATTGPLGAATFTALAVGGPAGAYTLRFSVAGLASVDAAAATSLAPGLAASLVIVTPPPATAVNGVALAPSPVVEVRDGASNPVADVVLAAAAAGGVALAPATATSAANGRATFTGLTLTGAAAAYTLQFCVGPCGSAAIGVSAPQATVLQPGPPATMTVTAAPSATAQSGVALASQPVVVVRDASLNPVPGVTVTATAAGAASVGGGSVVTDGAGVAAFTALAVSGTPAGYILELTSGAAVSSSSLVLGVGPAASVTFSQAPPAAAQAGTIMAPQPAVLVKDASDNVIAGALVTVTADNGGTVLNGTATTNASGIATFADLALSGTVGNFTLTFTAGTAAATAGVALAVGNAATVTITQQPSTTATNGSVLAAQPIVHVADASANPVAGTVVTASLTTAGATVAGATAITDASGNAVFSGLYLAGNTGPYTLQFAVSGLAAVPAASPTDLGPGPAAKLVFTTPPSQAAQNGSPLAAQPVVRITDAGGNLVPNSGTPVTAAVVGGGPALANGAATTASGIATFSGLTLTGAVGGYVLRFTAPGLDSLDAATVLQPGPATQLDLAAQPGTAAQSGIALVQQPVVQVRDASGNLVTGSAAVVTASTTAGVTLANASVAAAGGIATFSALTLSGTTGSYLLSFTSGALSGVSASALTVVDAGPAAQLTLTTQPSAGALSGIPLVQQPVVQLRDGAGNAVLQPNVTVTASVVGGGASLAGATASTSPSGAATFTGLAVAGPVGPYTLRFSASGAGTVDAAGTLALAHGAPDTLVIVTPPPATAVNGIALATASVVELRDGAGNPIPDSVVTVSAFGNVVVTGGTATTAANGRATFPGLTLTGTASGYSLQYCLGPCVSATVVVPAPQPTALEASAPDTVGVTTAPSAAAQSGIVLAAQPSVRVTDQSGNVIAGASVALTVAGATVANGAATTDSAGVAVFAGVAVSGPPAAYTWQFQAGTATATAPLALSAGPPAVLTLTTGAPASAADGIVFTTQPVVLVEDATENPLPGRTVTVTDPGATTVLNGTAATNGSGVATFAGLGLIGTPGQHVLTFTSGAATAQDTVMLDVGPAAALTFITQPSNAATNGVPLAIQPAVHVEDISAANVVGAVVTASLTSGGATIANATAVTDVNGIATFSGLTLVGTVGPYTLQFGVSGLAPVAAGAPTVLGAGPAAALMLTTAPSASAVNAVALATQPVVQVVDIGGNAVAGGGTAVSASLTASGAALAGAGATTGAGGSAAFTGLTATGLVGAYTIRFSASGLDSVEAPLTLTPGAATALALVTEPSRSTPAGVAMARQPVVRLRDVSGNTVPQAGKVVTVSPADPSVVLQGDPTVATDATGVATFTDVGFASPRGHHLLRFSASPYATISAAESTVVAFPLTLSVPVSDSASFDEERPYVFEILPNDTLLVVQISGGQGTADLVVRYGEAPHMVQGLFDCYPRLAGSEETCVFRNPAPGMWYATVLAFPFSFVGVTLTVNSFP